MERILRASAIALVVGLAVVALPSASSGRAAGPCNAATAKQLVEQQHLGNAGSLAQPVAQVLCGAFAGPGSKAMAVSLSTPGCGVSIGWVVYRLRGGAWTRAFLTNNGAYLAKAGTRIRTWNGVLGPNDPHCLPSGWKVRDWHWNGKRLVPGRWHKSGPPPNPLPGVTPPALP